MAVRLKTHGKREDVPLLKPEARSGDAITVDTLPQVSERGVSEWVANKLRVLRVKDNIKDIATTDPSQSPTSLDDLRNLARDLFVTVHGAAVLDGTDDRT